MKIRAIADGLLHPVSEVTEGTNSALARNGHDRTKPVLGDDDVYVLGLQAAKNGGFSALRHVGVVDELPTLAPLNAKGRSRCDLFRQKAAFDDKPAGHVPV